MPRLIEIPAPDGEPLDAPPPGGPVFRIDHPLYESASRADWLAEQLLVDDDLFHDRVHVPAKSKGKGGAKGAAAATATGGAAKGGAKAVTYATFRGVVDHMLRESPRVETVCLPDDLVTQAIYDGPNSLAHHKVEQGGLLLSRLFLHYWRAVARAFPDAWGDHHDHLLWHPHGLSALGSLGARVVQDQVDAYDIRQHYFDGVLERVAASVSLKKADYAEVAPHDLTTHLLDKLASARAAGAKFAGLTAVPGTVGSIDWGSTVAPRSPDIDIASAS